MFCPNCGEKVDPNAKFCSKCGKSLHKSNESNAFNKENVNNAVNHAKDSVKSFLNREDVKSGMDKINSTINSGTKKINDRMEKAGVKDKVDSTINSGVKQINKGMEKVGIKDKGKKKKFIIGISAVVVVLLCYFGLYVPHSIKSALASQGFTSQNGYTINVSPFSKTADVIANSQQVSSISTALNNNGYDTSRIDVENKLSSVANSLSQNHLGTVKLNLTQNTYDHTPKTLWSYSGNTETFRYQTSEQCIKAHDAYIQNQDDQKDANDSANAAAGGALVGGVLGAAFGSATSSHNYYFYSDDDDF